MALRNCNCVSAFQDRVYGRGRRVYNELGKDRTGRAGGLRCSVCEDTKSAPVLKASKGVKVKYNKK